MNVLRQATASQSRAIGPFLDDTDFKTEETALSIANTDVKLIVNGAASANKNSGGATHRANGVYGVTFDATDTAAVGELEVTVKVAGALPVFKTFFVVEEAVYDALYAASAPGFLSLATIAEGTFTVQDYLKLFAAALSGKLSGLPGSPVFRNPGDTKNRITATTDASGNRSAVSYDLS